MTAMEHTGIQHPRVSILTPMYNTQKYVHRLLDSVLAQDYPDIEMVVVDDGSTDGSAEVVQAYVPRFSARGYVLRYVYQANSGQSVAIQNGLHLISGEYLAWPDSDDFYATEDAISKMVGVLESAGEAFQMVRTQVRYVEDGTLRLLRTRGEDAHEEEDASLFEDCLFAQNGFYYCAGSYLVRTRVLQQLTGMEIYTEKNAGQNWQLLLPVLYKYRCKTILEPLYTVVERASSHSRGQYSGFSPSLVKIDAYHRTQWETLRRIPGIPEPQLSAYQRRLLAQKDRWRREQSVLRLPGGACLLKTYKEAHHQLHLLKKSLSRHGR